MNGIHMCVSASIVQMQGLPLSLVHTALAHQLHDGLGSGLGQAEDT